MNKSLAWIAETTGGELHGDPNLVFHNVATDTRKVFDDASIFVALTGDNFDGHRYLEEAHAKGAVAFLVSQPIDSTVPHVVVPDTLLALQTLAQSWRAELATNVIAVTGSNGKTIVKDMLAGMLSRLGTTFRSPGSYNSQLGVALSLLALRPEHTFAVIEAGISEVGEMAALARIIAPNAVVWTNVGDAHSRGLGGPDGIAREKAKLTIGVEGPIVFPAVDERITSAVAENKHAIAVTPSDLESVHGGYTFRLTLNGVEEQLSVFALGEHNVVNASLAARMASEHGVSTEDIRRALVAYEPVDLRLQIHTTQRGVTLINDSYNADPTSMRAALAVLEHFGAGHRKLVVVGDMLDLGDVAASEHEKLGAVLAERGVDRVIALGEFAQHVIDGAVSAGMLDDRCLALNDISDAADAIRDEARPGDYVLVKGSRALQLDRVAAQFLDSVGPARLTVDLDTLAENIAAIRHTLGNANLMAVVKSFAYGNDATRISQALIHQGVESFAVAYPDEAIPLRRRGIDVPILVTNVFADEVDKIARYDLDALISRVDLIEAIAASSNRRGKVIGVHLEIETGMNRLGIRPADAVAAAKKVAASDGLTLRGVMTHFAAADDPAEDPFTKDQIATFDEVIRALRAEGIDPGVVHAANTAAAWRFPESRYDAVRIGLGIYGLHPSNQVATVATTNPVLKFSTKVIDVRDVNAGETVGYGRTWKASKLSRIATIAVGYNDGFRRFMSNGGEVLIGGVRCSVVGNVCMDATMVDVTDVENVEVGSEVVLFGSQGESAIGVDEIAKRGQTISYEILTGISPRVRRIFERS